MEQFRIDEIHNIKLLDFELARSATSNADDYILAGGDFEYLEPESIKPNPFNFLLPIYCNKRSEIYRLGILIYYIIFEIFPFFELTWKKLYKDKKENRVQYPRYTLKQEKVPPRILCIIKKCIDINPENRYNSSEEISI